MRATASAIFLMSFPSRSRFRSSTPRSVRGRAVGIEYQQDFLLLDELARLLHRLGRSEGVVQGNEFDLASVDASLRVEHLEVAQLHFARRAVSGSRAAVGFGLSDFDLGIARAWVVLLLRKGRGQCGGKGDTNDNTSDW